MPSQRQERNVAAFIGGVTFIITIALLTACGSNPTQVALDVCDGYYEALKGVNDGLETKLITPESDAAQSMKNVDAILYPVCTGEVPAEDLDRETLQRDIERILIDLIKAEKERES